MHKKELQSLHQALKHAKHPYSETKAWVFEYIFHNDTEQTSIPEVYILPKIHKPITVGRSIAAGHSFATTPFHRAVVASWTTQTV